MQEFNEWKVDSLETDVKINTFIDIIDSNNNIFSVFNICNTYQLSSGSDLISCS